MTSEWDHTHKATQRLEGRIGPDGDFKGRFIIRRDSPIDGGVYVGKGVREALVVDSEKDPEIRSLYEKLKSGSTDKGVIDKGTFLVDAYDAICELFDWDKDSVKALIAEMGLRDDKKVYLGHFIKRGIGICRHAALTMGVMLELFKKEGHISGDISLDRNQTEEGGHAWIRYTDSKGSVVIFDPALEYIGPLEGALKAVEFDYRRPTD